MHRSGHEAVDEHGAGFLSTSHLIGSACMGISITTLQSFGISAGRDAVEAHGGLVRIGTEEKSNIAAPVASIPIP
jgi:hypothetical protein